MLAFQTREGIVTKLDIGRVQQCPLWVKSRHLQCKPSCPLYPRKRTFAAHPDGVGASTCCSSITRAGGALCVADIGRKLASRAMLNMAIAVWRMSKTASGFGINAAPSELSCLQ
jgi:hypothetical protein